MKIERRQCEHFEIAVSKFIMPCGTIHTVYHANVLLGTLLLLSYYFLDKLPYAFIVPIVGGALIVFSLIMLCMFDYRRLYAYTTEIDYV